MVDITEKIILDTNFMLIPAQFGVDVFTELEKLCHFKFELYLLDKSLKELENIEKKQKGAQKRAAELAVSLIKSKKINIIQTSTERFVDDILVEEGRKGYIIATQDKELKDRLKENKIRTIILRQKKYLKFG